MVLFVIIQNLVDLANILILLFLLSSIILNRVSIDYTITK